MLVWRITLIIWHIYSDLLLEITPRFQWSTDDACAWLDSSLFDAEPAARVKGKRTKIISDYIVGYIKYDVIYIII